MGGATPRVHKVCRTLLVHLCVPVTASVGSIAGNCRRRGLPGRPFDLGVRWQQAHIDAAVKKESAAGLSAHPRLLVQQVGRDMPSTRVSHSLGASPPSGQQPISGTCCTRRASRRAATTGHTIYVEAMLEISNWQVRTRACYRVRHCDVCAFAR